MSLNLPQAIDDYKAPTAMELSRAVWDSVFLSISTRIKALEGNVADYNEAVLRLETQALSVISNTITTEINAQRATLDQLQQEFTAVQQAFNEVLSGGVSASSVSISGVPGLVATRLDAALTEMLAKLTEIPEKATPEEVLAGIDDTKFITPSTLKQSGAGGVTQAALMVAGVF